MPRSSLVATLLLLASGCGGGGAHREPPAASLDGWWGGIATPVAGDGALQIGFNLTRTDTTDWRVQDLRVFSDPNCYPSQPYLEIQPGGPAAPGVKVTLDLWPSRAKTGRHLQGRLVLQADRRTLSGSYTLDGSAPPCADSAGNLTLLNTGGY